MRTNMREMKRSQKARASGLLGRTRKGRATEHNSGGEGPPGMPDAFDDTVVHVDQGDGVLVPGAHYSDSDGPCYALPDAPPPGWGEP